MFARKNFFVFLFFLFALCVRVLFAKEYRAVSLSSTTLQAQVMREPERFADRQRVIVQIESTHDRVRLTLPLQPRVHFGDIIAFRCDQKQWGLSKKQNTDSSFFRTPIDASCFYPALTIVGTSPSVARTLLMFKGRMTSGLQRSMPAPEGFIVSAMLFGNGASIPQNIWDMFRVTGTTHLLVISGMHIIFLANVLLWLCTFFPIPRRASLVLTAGLLLLYVGLAGFQSATVRALVFGLIAFCAEWFERRVSAMRLLLYAAMLMLLIQPTLLLYDIGFQLSFAAVAGILVATHLLKRYRDQPKSIEAFFAATLGASIFTMPIIAWHFHTVSIISPLVNFFAVPLVTVVMAGGVVLTCIASISSSFAAVASLPIFFLLRFLLVAIAWCAQISFALFSW